MTNDQIKAYTLRVSQASECGLVVILYDIILEDISTAKKALADGDKQKFHADLKHAGLFVNELMKNLDFSVPMSHNFISLYIYSQRVMTRAEVAEKAEELESVEDVFVKLRDGFKEIDDKISGAPVMTNVQQVYAGLTYGRGCLNEAYVNASDYNRGFSA